MSYVSIRAGDTHAMALRSDGQLVAWGLNDWGQCNVPALPPGTSWQSFDAGGLYSVAVRSDGEVVCWGRNYYFEGNIPALPPQRYYESFACGARTIVAVMDDGQLQAWGDSSAGATNVPQPAGRFFTAVDASMWVSGGLLDDGTILVWGWNGYNQQTVPVLPVGVTYTAIAVGGGHVLGLRSDGNVEAWGSNDVGQTVIPALPPGTTYTQIRSYERCNLMLRSDGALVASGLPSQAQAAVAAPTLPAGERWRLIDMGDHIFGGISTEGQLYFWGSAPAWLAPTPPGVVWVEFACNRGRAVARRSDGVAFEVTNQLGTYYSLLPAPDLEPGTSYLSVSAGHETFAARVGAESSFVTFASGCSGSMPTSRQIPHDTPQLGRQLEVSVDHLPLDVAFVAFGRQRLATPLSLSGVGMPGCAAHIAIDGMVAVVGSNNRATWTWSLPDDPTIRGQRFVTQAIVLDTGAGNALGAVVSDAAEGLIGGGM